MEERDGPLAVLRGGTKLFSIPVGNGTRALRWREEDPDDAGAWEKRERQEEKSSYEAFGVSLVTVAANYLELMKNVVAVGSDLEWSYRSIACPSVLFTGAAISGK